MLEKILFRNGQLELKELGYYEWKKEIAKRHRNALNFNSK